MGLLEGIGTGQASARFMQRRVQSTVRSQAGGDRFRIAS